MTITMTASNDSARIATEDRPTRRALSNCSFDGGQIEPGAARDSGNPVLDKSSLNNRPNRRLWPAQQRPPWRNEAPKRLSLADHRRRNGGKRSNRVVRAYLLDDRGHARIDPRPHHDEEVIVN